MRVLPRQFDPGAGEACTRRGQKDATIDQGVTNEVGEQFVAPRGGGEDATALPKGV